MQNEMNYNFLILQILQSVTTTITTTNRLVFKKPKKKQKKIEIKINNYCTNTYVRTYSHEILSKKSPQIGNRVNGIYSTLQPTTQGVL